MNKKKLKGSMVVQLFLVQLAVKASDVICCERKTLLVGRKSLGYT